MRAYAHQERGRSAHIRGRKSVCWKVIFYNTHACARAHIRSMVLPLLHPSLLVGSGLNTYMWKKWRRAEDTMKDGSSTVLIYFSPSYPIWAFVLDKTSGWCASYVSMDTRTRSDETYHPAEEYGSLTLCDDRCSDLFESEQDAMIKSKSKTLKRENHHCRYRSIDSRSLPGFEANRHFVGDRLLFYRYIFAHSLLALDSNRTANVRFRCSEDQR